MTKNKVIVYVYGGTLDGLDPTTRRQAVKLFNSKEWQAKTVDGLLESTKMEFKEDEKIVLTIKAAKDKIGALVVDLARMP